LNYKNKYSWGLGIGDWGLGIGGWGGGAKTPNPKHNPPTPNTQKKKIKK